MASFNTIVTPSADEISLMNRDDDVGSLYYDIYQGHFSQPNKSLQYGTMTKDTAIKSQENPIILLLVLLGIFFVL